MAYTSVYTTVNPDLQRERDNASFRPDEITHFLDKGREKTERRRYIENLVIRDADFAQRKDTRMLSQDEFFREASRKSYLSHKKLGELNITDPLDVYHYNNQVFPFEVRPDAIHLSMFIAAMDNQMNDQQRAKWLHMAKTYQIIGTYAQTELGHGTYLRGLETEATYDPATQEFIIHSPTLSSTKYWPGGIGKTCNYALVQANLKVGGQVRGMHGFMVQLRDIETHQPCKGVKMGDIGPKMSFNSIDNGYVQFDHVRIPRDHMLMKYAQVTPSGEYIRTTPGSSTSSSSSSSASSSASAKLGYFPMIYIRSLIVVDPVSTGMCIAATIATRYSAVRRQSEKRPGEPEPQIMDYQTQQYKVFPAIAAAYAFRFAGDHIAKVYHQVKDEIQEGNTNRLPELHALAAGLKSFTSTQAMSLVETVRLACGGHGYSAASGLPKVYAIVTPSNTYEGENTVLLLQTARFLVKIYDMLPRLGSDMLRGTSVSYIGEELGTKSAICEQANIEDLIVAYKNRAKHMIKRAVATRDRLVSVGKDKIDAVNGAAVHMAQAARAHSHLCVLQVYYNAVLQSGLSAKPLTALMKLCKLYALYGITQHAGEFIQDGFMSAVQLSHCDQSLLAVLSALRPDAVALVDAFDISDTRLHSSLGRYDGNVYQSLMEFAENSPLNEKQVHDVFEKYVKPTRDVLAAKL